MSAHHVGRPAFSLGVGKVPALGDVGGRGDDADGGELLADELDTLAARLIGIRPEQDAALGKG